MNIGGTSIEQALASLSDMTAGMTPIGKDEHAQRIVKAQTYMREQGIAAIYLNAGANLTYFTGTKWYASERMVGAILPASGPLEYIAPAFEESTLQGFMLVEGKVNCWEEYESPYQLFVDVLARMGIPQNTAHRPRVGICESAAFFIYDGIKPLAAGYALENARTVTAYCRSRKSTAEIALMQRVMDMTLAVHVATASMLYEGITTTEVEEFIQRAHRKVGAPRSYFCIVLFGEATAYPHGVNYVQTLKPGDMVLIDTGCQVMNYISDITRSYVYGTISERQRSVWNSEKKAQAAAFAAAQLGVPCGDVDRAARTSLASDGFGPGYKLPGLPHRTGHGIGLDIHEWPYLVGSDSTPLDVGMCFSNEPMICIPGEFGIRHEDHFYMTENGPRWFTQPAHSIDDPFGLNS
ncbi:MULTISPECIES: Xaa-Pro peptidase family protein [unclassified Janthinobacterium]|uniref:M24 family metallopeptidase n=1 Tax=unclassified Janthinobacterium TaxID=2610881 RepID=UPI001610B381|nr:MULTISPECIES: Xaa-Pro peptidase family protein [unclassified Janthinobacterium]MBB5607487.1 Xaa-Pro dipeptidase [Janthinobacterium sp. S3T4]MBB5612508.1 Xaa-Pro dipeptidase [Janthinobacterium sp. S3M3]